MRQGWDLAWKVDLLAVASGTGEFGVIPRPSVYLSSIQRTPTKPRKDMQLRTPTGNRLTSAFWIYRESKDITCESPSPVKTARSTVPQKRTLLDVSSHSLLLAFGALIRVCDSLSSLRSSRHSRKKPGARYVFSNIHSFPVPYSVRCSLGSRPCLQ